MSKKDKTKPKRLIPLKEALRHPFQLDLFNDDIRIFMPKPGRPRIFNDDYHEDLRNRVHKHREKNRK